MRTIIGIIGFVVILFLAIFLAVSVFDVRLPFLSPSATVEANGNTFNVEIAKSPKQQELGLSGRDSLEKNRGMLFIFEKADYYAFWMKDMKFAIDIIFINGDKIVTIHENVPPQNDTPVENLPHFLPTEPADKVLEIQAGLSKTYDLRVGDTIKINL